MIITKEKRLVAVSPVNTNTTEKEEALINRQLEKTHENHQKVIAADKK